MFLLKSWLCRTGPAAKSCPAMSSPERRNDGRKTKRSQRPPEPENPPGLSPAGPKASTLAGPAPVAPIRRGTEEPAEDRHRGRSRSRARRRRHKKAKPAERPAPKKPPTSSPDSSSKEEVEDEPSGPAAASSSLCTDTCTASAEDVRPHCTGGGGVL